MSWSPQQDAALRAVDAWIRDPSAPQVYRLFGYAGTGKTTMARHLAEGVDGVTLFGAYTGKAAHVLRQKGCSGASTIHSLIYVSRDKGQAHLKKLEAEYAAAYAELKGEAAEDEDVSTNRVMQTLRQKIDEERERLSQPTFTLNRDSEVQRAELVVIDECSMVDGQMGQDLLSFGTKVLVLGDPAQLPPVRGAGFFTENVEPDTMLTEIHRQARDNPIIHLATLAREGARLDDGDYGESQVTGRKLNPDEVLAFDQVLVGRNKTRHACDRRIRALLGHEEGLPVKDDRLVCLRNNHDVGLLNGAIWYCEEFGGNGGDTCILTIRPENQEFTIVVEAHVHHFLGREGQLNWWERNDAQEFDYGYALTCHKAQGSQWDETLIFDESYCFRKDRHRWLYTAITRAAERVVIART